MNRMIKYAKVLGMAAALPIGVIAGDCQTECAKVCPTVCAEVCPCPATSAAKEACVAPRAAKLTKVEYQVSGMSCPADAAKVTKAVAKLDGVSEPSACAKSGKAVVAIDTTRVKDAQLLAAIEQAGCKVEKEVLKVKVQGLKCEDCSAKVSQAVAAVQGAKVEGVCHQSGQAIVSFDPKKVSRGQVLAAIDRTGFSVVP